MLDLTDWLRGLLGKGNRDPDSDRVAATPWVSIVSLIVVGALGVALIVLGSGRRFDPPAAGPAPTSTAQVGNEETQSDYAAAMELSLERALGHMRGIGKVSVVVTLETDTRKVLATATSDDTEQVEERDSSGGVRTTKRTTVTEEPVVTRSASGDESLVVLGFEPPEVRGVLVVAQGAADPAVKLEIAQAVSSLLGIALYRVAVVEREV